MASFYDDLTEAIQEFIRQQHLFFVATAPLSADGHVNLSPKGHDTFRILSASQVAYLDLTGSGSETSAHILENGRITLMWCAFEGPPTTVRVYGRGRAVLPGDPDWAVLSSRFPDYLGARQIIVVDVTQAMTSCGYSVPRYAYGGERDTLERWSAVKGPEGLAAYRQRNNLQSLDCLPTPLGAKPAE